jgi:ribosomal protein S18 acetylase RimI-like enzyme
MFNLRKLLVTTERKIYNGNTFGIVWYRGPKFIGDNLIGYGDWRIHKDKKYGELIHLGVREKYRNKGYGTGIAKHMIDDIKKYDINTIVLDVHPRNWMAQDLFKKVGFEMVDSNRMKQLYETHYGSNPFYETMRLAVK